MSRDLNAIKCTISAIESADANIARLEKFRTFGELLIIPNQPKIKDLISKFGYADPDNPNGIYASGENKNILLDALIQKHQEFKNNRLAALEKELSKDLKS